MLLHDMMKEAAWDLVRKKELQDCIILYATLMDA